MRAAARTSRRHVKPVVPRNIRAWSHSEFRRQLARVKSIGAEGVSDDDLLQFCRGAHNYFKRFWADMEPFFQELWRRIEKGRISLTKTQACSFIGCSLRWAEKIVAGTARPSATVKEGTPESGTTSKTPEQRSNREYVLAEISYGAKTLRPVLARGEKDRYRNISRLLATYFAEARKVPHVEAVSGIPKTEAKGGSAA